MRLLERAGAAAVQIEDQIFPKKCGHFSGKGVVPLPEMLGKVAAALDVRRSEDTLIIARTDSRAVEGFERAVERASAMAEAGADIIFVEAPKSVEEMRRHRQACRSPSSPMWSSAERRRCLDAARS